MALLAAFTDLVAHLQSLDEAIVGLRTAVREDKPRRDDAVLVDLFGDAADDLLGWLEEALMAAGDAERAAEHPLDLQRARQALVTCQERFNRVAHRFSSDLVRYERIAELAGFGRARGGEWRAWSSGVRLALDRCQQPLFDVNEVLFRCWYEITEPLGMLSAAVLAAGLGQSVATPAQITPRAEGRGAAETLPEGIE